MRQPARTLRRKTIVIAAALAPIAALTVAVALPETASATSVPPAPPGMTTVFSDSFSGGAGSGVDSSWTYDTGTHYSGTGCTGQFGTGEVESNTASTANVSEDGAGHLNVTAVDNGGSWTSGRIETVADNFAAPAGGELEVSASIEQPNPASGVGYWPAFWMLGAGFRGSGAGTSGTMDCANWPSIGEIDVMEDVNALSEHSGTLHCGVDPGGPCNETTGISSGLQPCSGCQTGFHTYSVLVNRTNTSAESITWSLDGTAYLTVNESQVGTATWQAAVDHGFFLILDNAMGGAYPDAICGCSAPSAATSSGGAMKVGYVAVYQGAGSTGTAQEYVSAASGRCLDDPNASQTGGTVVDVWDCHHGQNQEWTYTGSRQLTVFGNYCLDVRGQGTTAGTLVDIWPCNGQANEQWNINSNGTITGVQSGLCLDVRGGGNSPNGTQMDIWTCNGGTNQRWSTA